MRFEVARATDYPNNGYGLVCFFDTLHDLGDSVGAAQHAAQAGAKRLAKVFRKAGFTHFRRAADTPFNLIAEVRR